MAETKIKIDSRVKRKKIPGCCGVVKDMRAETSSSGVEVKEKNLMVKVLWDNGTLSYLTTESLEAV